MLRLKHKMRTHMIDQHSQTGKWRYDVISTIHGTMSFCLAIEVSVKGDHKRSYSNTFLPSVTGWRNKCYLQFACTLITLWLSNCLFVIKCIIIEYTKPFVQTLVPRLPLIAITILWWTFVMHLNIYICLYIVTEMRCIYCIACKGYLFL